MTKTEAMKLNEKYGMQIMREAITNMGTGTYLHVDKCIPELDELAAESARNNALDPCHLIAEYYDGGDLGAVYKLFVPASWIDLWGWS